MKASPDRIHQCISMFLSAEIFSYIRGKRGGCGVYTAPFSVFLYPDNKKKSVEPDISVICSRDKLSDRGCEGAPDWIIEIVSPASEEKDYGRNRVKYCDAGVREYWILDWVKDKVTVFGFERGEITEYSFSDKVKVGIYEDLEIDFAEITEYVKHGWI